MRKYKFFKVLSIVLTIAVTAFLTWLFIDVLIDAKTNTENTMQGLGWAIFIMFGIVYVGGIGGGVALLSALTGLICTLVTCPKGERKGQVLFFIVLIVLPILIEAGFFIATLIAT